jgi:hypothetical protein
MLNLKNPEGFFKAAQFVAQENSIESASLLIQTLIRSTEYLQWDQSFYSRLSNLAIFPLYNFQNLALPPKDCWFSPKYIPPRKEMSTKGGSVGLFLSSKKSSKSTHSSKNKKSKRGNVSEEFMEDLSQVESLDFDEEMNESEDVVDKSNNINSAELFKHATSLLNESCSTAFSLDQSHSDNEKLFQFIQSIPISSKPYIVLCKLSTLSVSLYSNLWQCWTSAFILPKFFDNCPPEILRKLNLTSLNPLHLILTHIRNIVPLWIKQLSRSSVQCLPLSTIKFFQAIILFSCIGIHNNLRLRPSLAESIQKNLYNIPFIIMDDGDCVLASNLVMDLDTDITTSLRVVPPYLVELGYLLNLIGATGITNIPRPVIKVSNPLINQQALLHKILNSFNNKDLSDVEFRIADVSSRPSKFRSIYAHKLILGINCPFFFSMFTSGMKESNSNNAVIQIEEDIGYEATLLFLHYLYFGNLDRPGLRLLPYSQETVTIVLGLLRLSDRYFVDYVKQW